MISEWKDATTPHHQQALALDALERFGWNQAETAFRLGVRREVLNRKLAAWGGRPGLREKVAGRPRIVTAYTAITRSTDITGITGNTAITPITCDTATPSVPEDAVQLTSNGSTSSLTPDRLAPSLSIIMEATAATAAAEAPKVRIPAVSVEMDREEDFYLSQRLAMARITGGPRSRQAIVRECVRRCMELDRRQAETSEPAE